MPNLIHPVDVAFEIPDESEVVADGYARETVFGSRTLGVTTTILPAQIAWIDKDDPDYEGTGVTEDHAGYLTMRVFDIDQAGVTIKRGTKITAVGNFTGLALFVNKSKPCGHYPGHDGATLVRWYFNDRNPAAWRVSSRDEAVAPRVSLIHPINVTFGFLDKSEMIDDDFAREPVFGSRSLKAATSTVTLPAQITWIDKDDPKYVGTGATEECVGYLTMRLYDIDQAGVTIERGTEITTIGTSSRLGLFVTKNQPCGHYPEQGGAGLIRFYFEDRRPAVQKYEPEEVAAPFSGFAADAPESPRRRRR